MAELLDSITFLKHFEETGPSIASIVLKSDSETEYDAHYGPFQHFKCIGDCFSKKEKHQRYYFGTVKSFEYNIDMKKEEYDKFGIEDLYKCGSVYKDDISFYSKEYGYDGFGPQKYIHHEVMTKIVTCIRQPAEFGDIQAGETKVDPNIRQGYSVLLNVPKSPVHISEDVIKDLTYAFMNMTGITNIKVVPYKMNIYEKGHFFKRHVDTPEENMIATIICDTDGYPFQECFKIDDTIWTRKKGNMCIFYSDVPHEVLPLDGYRETFTFKVYCTNQLQLKLEINPEGNPITKNLCQRIDFDKPFGILLQNGYSVDMLKDKMMDFAPKLKGKDRELVKSLIEIGKDCQLIPVVVNDLILAEHDYNDPNSWDEDEKYLMDDPQMDEFDGKSDEISKRICVYEISNKLQQYLKKKIALEIPKLEQKYNVYYLGKGYKVGEIERKNYHIGNQSTGHSIKNVYFSLMLINK